MLDHGDDLSGGRLDDAAPTLVRLTAVRSPVAEGEPVVLSAQVVTVHHEGPPPTGSVAFRARYRLLGAAPLDSAGVAVLSGVRLPPGVHPVVASYGGDVAHAPATSPPIPQAVVETATPVLVAVSVPRLEQRGVLLQAQLLDAHTGRLVEEAVGSLTFALDDALLGSAPLEGGEASLLLPDVPPGRISARFLGDAEHAPARGECPEVEGPT